jgi:hypothetical protein
MHYFDSPPAYPYDDFLPHDLKEGDTTYGD